MKNKHKLFLMVLPLMITGCNRNSKFVVRGVLKNVILATDLKTGDDKVFILNTRYDHLKYMYPDDTIYFCPVNYTKCKKHLFIDIPKSGHMIMNKDSLNVRQNRYFYSGTRYMNR